MLTESWGRATRSERAHYVPFATVGSLPATPPANPQPTDTHHCTLSSQVWQLQLSYQTHAAFYDTVHKPYAQATVTCVMFGCPAEHHTTKRHVEY